MPYGLSSIYLRDFDTIGAMEFVQLVGVADNEIHGCHSLESWAWGCHFSKKIWTLPRFTPANVGGSPQLNAC